MVLVSRFRITSPLILIVMACVMYVSYRIQKLQAPVVLFGKIFSVNQLCVATNVAAIPILYLFGAGSIMFWVIGKLEFAFVFASQITLTRFSEYFRIGASTFVVALHASFYNIDAIVTEEFEAFLPESETVWIPSDTHPMQGINWINVYLLQCNR